MENMTPANADPLQALQLNSMDQQGHGLTAVGAGGEQTAGIFSVDRVWYLMVFFDGVGQSLILLSIAIAIALLRRIVRPSSERRREFAASPSRVLGAVPSVGQDCDL
jgi:hypothetical protein